jgi:alanyl-tRNA synthetase
MSSAEIRSSSQVRRDFLDFFRSKQHTLVPSASLMPDAPNLLFTNAGMNQFVPIFLGQRKPDVSRWPGAIAGLDTRAADPQKCIRAGGKHNDLDDVGLDTYHHTFFEMLGNWSFGDYFKKEAIDWAWELVTEVWKFPKKRIYATVYNPDKSKGEPSEFDQEAWDCWAGKFRAAGLDPAVHIVNGDKKDNFWMMGDTGPCGPCSEIHVDLTPSGDTEGALVNKGDARCIEIWNLVFIQFNANPDGTFSPLPAKHVDTGMGFERVTSIIQGTRGFKDFANTRISNYETDIFRPLFDELEKLSGRKYSSTLPPADLSIITQQQSTDVAFRVIADHIRALGFAIADGILPGNTDRNYVLRRILRRAVRYGRTLDFHEPFFYKLVEVLAQTMGDVFPEIREKRMHVQEVIRTEEEAFNRTLDRGIALFEEEAAKLLGSPEGAGTSARGGRAPRISGAFAFRLYDEQGFPLDLTELMARERGLTVDKAGFEKLMDEQKARARAAQKKEVISVSQIETVAPTRFIGYDQLDTPAKVLEVVSLKDKIAVILDTTACYAEMGGQVGDTGELEHGSQRWRITNTQKSGNTWLHILDSRTTNHQSRDTALDLPQIGSEVTLTVDKARRNAIQRHHTVTHLFHWALHEVVSPDARQKGSYVGPDKLTFDFNSGPLTTQQVADIEKLVNERILENTGVSWTEIPFADVKDRRDILQFFGDKYGETVRVVQIGGRPQALDGYSMELCGGTHTRATGEMGLFRIVAESAIAAGVRRIEAVAGLEAYRKASDELHLIKTLAGRVNAPVSELEKKIESLLAHQKQLEKEVKLALQRNASNAASELLGRAQTVNGIPFIAHNMGNADGDFLQAVADALKGRFKGVVVLGGCANEAVALVASVSPEFTSRAQAGKIIQQIAPLVGGKGGGKPDNARGGGRDASKLDEALLKAKGVLG